MYSIFKDMSCHIPHRDVVRRVHAWLLLLPPTNQCPSRTVLYKVVADHLETFLAALDADPDAKVCRPMSNVNFTTTCNVSS